MLKNVFCYDIIEAELWDFNDIFVHPRKPYFSLKNKPFDLCFTFFCKISLGYIQEIIRGISTSAVKLAVIKLRH